MADKMIKISNGCDAKIAEYIVSIILDYNGNPLIEALPDLLTNQEVIEKLTFYPQYNFAERQQDSHYKIHMVNRLFQVFQPLPFNVQLENRIARTIRQGYVARNPFRCGIANGFHSECEDKIYNPSASGFTLIGVSGIGKTTALHHVLNLYPQVIIHNEYCGNPFSSYQVVWLKLECPFDGSIKGLIYSFFSSIDKLLGTNYYKKASNATTDKMITIMNQVVLNTNLGILVIDEIQHLSLTKSGGSQKMLNFFVNLVNSVGVPVVLVGTPKAMNILGGEFRFCRRGIGVGGDMICDRLHKDGVWNLLLRGIWNYQWTKDEIKLTNELNDAFYEETQGIPDLLVKLYAITQVYSISTGKEDITPSIVKKVARENFNIVRPIIKALKSGNVREMAKYEDVYIPDIDFNDLSNRTKESIKLNFAEKERINKLKQDEENKEEENTVKNKKEHIKESATNSNELSPADIRYIVQEGVKNNINAYDALKTYGYIKNYNKDIFMR